MRERVFEGLINLPDKISPGELSDRLWKESPKKISTNREATSVGQNCRS